jgi:hypothetical protein
LIIQGDPERFLVARINTIGFSRFRAFTGDSCTGPGRANVYHSLKSLTYFADAEREPMPTMLEPLDWKECKVFFVREAHAIVLPE